MTKEKAKEILMDFLVRKMGTKGFMAEALVNDYLNNDEKAASFIYSNPTITKNESELNSLESESSEQ